MYFAIKQERGGERENGITTVYAEINGQKEAKLDGRKKEDKAILRKTLLKNP